MLNLALIGKNIEHSLSPSIYEELLSVKFRYTLLNFLNVQDIPPLSDLLKRYPYISVTSPYKRHCFDLADKLSDVAKRTGALNTLKLEEGLVVGTNTDALAFLDLFEEYVGKKDFHYLILGDGAMSVMIQRLMEDMGKEFIVFSRRMKNLNSVDEYALASSWPCFLINTCSREYRFSFTTKLLHTVWDMNYKHRENTVYIEETATNVRYLDGLSLLRRQAQYAKKFWHL